MFCCGWTSYSSECYISCFISISVSDILRICDELRDDVLPDLGVCLEDKTGMDDKGVGGGGGGLVEYRGDMAVAAWLSGMGEDRSTVTF